MSDLINRQDAINAIHTDILFKPLDNGTFYRENNEFVPIGYVERILLAVPSAEPKWNNHTVACLLAELFDDTCACNYCGIDEWLPEKCEVIDACPNPVGVACWEQFLTHRKERG